MLISPEIQNALYYNYSIPIVYMPTIERILTEKNFSLHLNNNDEIYIVKNNISRSKKLGFRHYLVNIKYLLIRTLDYALNHRQYDALQNANDDDDNSSDSSGSESDSSSSSESE